MKPLLAAAAAFALVALACPAQAQVEGARELPVGETVSAPAGVPGQVDLYYFVGGPGARHNFTLKIKGDAEITLFTPTGEVMLTANGSGTIPLEAVLATLDVHTVAVMRADPAQPYTLEMTATEPDLLSALFAVAVGYDNPFPSGAERQCWITPGLRFRATGKNFTTDASLAADRKSSFYIVHMADGSDFLYEKSFQINGAETVRTERFSGSPAKESSQTLSIARFQPILGAKFTGYYCPGAEPAE
jgi:hypothetical protein